MVLNKKTKNKPLKQEITSQEDQVKVLEFIIDYINTESVRKSGKNSNKSKSLKAPLKEFHNLEYSQKDKVIRHTSEIIRTNYYKNQDFKNQIYKLAALFGHEKDWIHINLLLQSLMIGTINFDFLTKLCEKLFLILDEECASEDSSSDVAGTCLAVITEVGMQVKKNIENIDNSVKVKSLFFIEFLTSNMLARSNINNETMRIGLLCYFSKVEPLSQVNIQKILSRFGQSLLEHILQIYFTNEKKRDLAFYFLTEHLSDFIFSSPALAEMSNSVLRNQMLKNANEFPNLVKKYISHKMKDINFARSRSLVIHLSFLLREACEVNQKVLIESLLEIMFSYIYTFEGKSNETMATLYEIFGEIISTSKSAKAKEITAIIFDKVLASKKVIDSVHAYKLIHLDAKSGNIYQKIKSQLPKDDKPSPLDEILLLAG